MAEVTEARAVHPVQRLMDVSVVADYPRWADYARIRPRESEVEARARALEAWAKGVNDFLRDHRSQDGATLRVERVMEMVCSGCGNPWKEYEGACSYCGVLAGEKREAETDAN